MKVLVPWDPRATTPHKCQNHARGSASLSRGWIPLFLLLLLPCGTPPPPWKSASVTPGSHCLWQVWGGGRVFCLCIQTDGVRLPDKRLQALLPIKSLKNVPALSSIILKGWQRTASARGWQPAFVLFHTTGLNNGVMQQHMVSCDCFRF